LAASYTLAKLLVKTTRLMERYFEVASQIRNVPFMAGMRRSVSYAPGVKVAGKGDARWRVTSQ
jgi:hypothetical protein